MKRTFNSVDSKKRSLRFNIKGNQYRLIALIVFQVRTVFVLFAGTQTMIELMPKE